MSRPYDRQAGSLFDRARAAGVEPVGATLVLVGAALVLAAFTVLPWFRGDSGFFAGAQTHSTFADVRQLLQSLERTAQKNGLSGHLSFGASLTYFTWLGWTLLLSAAATAAVAVSRWGRWHWSLRWLAAVVAGTGLAFTFQAIDLFAFEGSKLPDKATAPSYGSFLTHTSLGMWSAAAGFLLLLIGSLVRSRAYEL